MTEDTLLLFNFPVVQRKNVPANFESRSIWSDGGLVHIGLEGTMNVLFLMDPAAKTHRGLRGRVEQGRSGDSLCYGYDVVKSFDGSGDPVRGGCTVNATEAETVRWVFREFACGASPRAIARRLNGENVPGPSGKLWTDSTIRAGATPSGEPA